MDDMVPFYEKMAASYELSAKYYRRWFMRRAARGQMKWARYYRDMAVWAGKAPKPPTL